VVSGVPAVIGVPTFLGNNAVAGVPATVGIRDVPVSSVDHAVTYVLAAVGIPGVPFVACVTAIAGAPSLSGVNTYRLHICRIMYLLLVSASVAVIIGIPVLAGFPTEGSVPSIAACIPAGC
jgi:hypothetical protein